jgi:hypothetical protein
VVALLFGTLVLHMKDDNEDEKTPVFVGDLLERQDRVWRERAEKMLEYSQEGPNQFSRKFLAVFHADFLKHGAAVIATVREKNPTAYLKTAAQLVPREFLVQVAKPMSELDDAELARIAMESAPRLIEHMAAEDAAADEEDDEKEE